MPRKQHPREQHARQISTLNSASDTLPHSSAPRKPPYGPTALSVLLGDGGSSMGYRVTAAAMVPCWRRHDRGRRTHRTHQHSCPEQGTRKRCLCCCFFLRDEIPVPPSSTYFNSAASPLSIFNCYALFSEHKIARLQNFQV